MKKKILIPIIGACTVIVVAVIILIIFLGADVQINLNDYMKISSYGYEGYGIADVNISKDEMLDEKIEELGIENYYNRKAFEELLDEAISCELDKSDRLSNGDTIVGYWEINEKLLEKIEETYECEFIYEDKQYTVDGLEEVTEYDPFAGLSVTFSGNDGRGMIEIVEPSYMPKDSDLKYEIDKKSNLSEGDTVTITVTDTASGKIIDGTDIYYDFNGVKLTESEKKYTVEGLFRYVRSLDQINDKLQNELLVNSEKYINKKINESYDNPETYQGCTYIGQAVYTKTTLTYTNPAIAMVYEINVKNGEEAFSYYTYVLFYDYMTNSKGDLSGKGDYDLPIGDWHPLRGGAYGEAFIKEGLLYVGFETIDELIEALKEYQNDDYAFEENITN